MKVDSRRWEHKVNILGYTGREVLLLAAGAGGALGALLATFGAYDAGSPAIGFTTGLVSSFLLRSQNKY